MEKQELICFTGLDGSGKSTIIDLLANHLDDLLVVSIWDLLVKSEHRHLLPFKHPSDIDKYLAILYPVPRLHFLFHCLSQALSMAAEKKSRYLIMDSYWYKYYASELAYGADPDVIKYLPEAFIKPSKLFYMKADVTVCAERKERYSGYESGFTNERSREDFIKFQQKVDKYLPALMAQHQCIAIDAERKPEDILEEIKKYFT